MAGTGRTVKCHSEMNLFSLLIHFSPKGLANDPVNPLPGSGNLFADPLQTLAAFVKIGAALFSLGREYQEIGAYSNAARTGGPCFCQRRGAFHCEGGKSLGLTKKPPLVFMAIISPLSSSRTQTAGEFTASVIARRHPALKCSPGRQAARNRIYCHVRWCTPSSAARETKTSRLPAAPHRRKLVGNF
jgi:hypothetical protein